MNLSFPRFRRLAAADQGKMQKIGWSQNLWWKAQIDQRQYQRQKLTFGLLFCSFGWTADCLPFSQRLFLCCSCIRYYFTVWSCYLLSKWCFSAFCLSLPAYRRTCSVHLVCKLRCRAILVSAPLSGRLWLRRWGCGGQRSCVSSCLQKVCKLLLVRRCWFGVFLRPAPLSYLHLWPGSNSASLIYPWGT